MDEMILGGIIAILSALPGLALGLALLMGKWRPVSLASARDPDHARIATGRFLVAISGLIVLLGTALIVVPEAQVRALASYATGAIVAVSIWGAIFLVRATRT